jgi:hypothetical protein
LTDSECLQGLAIEKFLAFCRGEIFASPQKEWLAPAGQA